MRAVGDLLGTYQHIIDEVVVQTGGAGAFEVLVDGDVLYSKKATGRHAEAGEVLSLFRQRYAAGVREYGS